MAQIFKYKSAIIYNAWLHHCLQKGFELQRHKTSKICVFIIMKLNKCALLINLMLKTCS